MFVIKLTGQVWTGQFESNLFENTEDRFSHDEAHIIYLYITILQILR